MNLRQLEIFRCVAERLSFSGAARQLHMAQPAVSIAMRKLESELGMALFQRARRRIQLTAEGEILLGHAGHLLQQYAQARREMGELRGLEAGVVRFSTTAMLGTYYFPGRIAAFRRRFPAIGIQVFNEGTRGALRLIADGAIDMGVVNLGESHPGLEVCPLVDEELVVCVSNRHRLARRKSITKGDFCAQQLVVYSEKYFLRELVTRIHREAGVEPKIIAETDLLGLIMELVREGEGLSIGLRSAALAEPGIVGIPFSDPMSLRLGMAWKRNLRLSIANRAFIDFLREECAPSRACVQGAPQEGKAPGR